MVSRKIHPQTLAENLQELMRAKGWSARRLAKESGVSDRFIGMVLKGDNDPSVETLEKLAAAFELHAWQLLMPGIKEFLHDGSDVEALIKNYSMADEAGRNVISRVAENESKFKK